MSEFLWEQIGAESFMVWDISNGHVFTDEGFRLKGICRGYVAIYPEHIGWVASTRGNDIKSREGRNKDFDTLDEAKAWVEEQARTDG